MMKADKFKIEREKLYDEIWTISVRGVAKKYNLHYAKLLLTCKENDIPIPESGYWTKKSYGKLVKQTSLPVLDVNMIEVEFQQSNVKMKTIAKENDKIEIIEEHNVKNIKAEENFQINNIYEIRDDALLFLTKDEREKLNIAIKELSSISNINYHSILLNNRNTYKNRQKDDIFLKDNKLTKNLFELVSEKSKRRIVEILNVIYIMLEKIDAEINKDFSITIRGISLSLTFKESQDNVEHKLTKEEAIELLKYKDNKKYGRYAYKPNIRKYDKVFNGRLSVQIGNGRYFRDKKNSKLEDAIIDIIVEILEEAEELRLKKIEREEKWRIAEEQRLKEQKIRERKSLEKENVKKLINIANDYDVACKLRNYISAFATKENLSKEDLYWIEWASKKADWFDPNVSREDEFFGKREHEKEDNEKNVYAKTGYWGY